MKEKHHTVENEQQQPIVEAQNLTKIFRDFWRRPKVAAVRDVNLTIRRGEVFGLLGPNGSGKSTTIKMLLGLLRPTSGSVRLFGKDPQSPAVRARIGYLPELSQLYKYLTPRETLDYYAGLFNIPRAVRRERIDALLRDTGMLDAAGRTVGEFSKGMARRVGIAQALLNDPELVILDEPTSGLDPLGRHDVKELIKRLAARGKTVLLSSHLLAEIEDVCDRVAILCDGELRAEGRLRDLLEQGDKTRLTLAGVPEPEIAAFVRRVAESGGEISQDRPAITLEQYFLAIVTQQRDSAT